jgi:hypothetical protein
MREKGKHDSGAACQVRQLTRVQCIVEVLRVLALFAAM